MKIPAVLFYPRFIRIALVGLTVASVFVWPRTAVSATAPWPEAKFTYIANGEKVTDVLGRFARTFALETQLTSAVLASTAHVNGKITTETPTEFLNQIGAAYGLTWFYQGGTLHVSRSNERTTQAIVPPGLSAASLKKALTEMGVVEEKFGWGDISDRGIALISGPPAYVASVARAVAELPELPPEQEMQIFKLRHAPVDDRTIFFRDKQITTAGVATILRSLVSGDAKQTGTNIQLAELAAPLRNSATSMPTVDELARTGTRSENPGSAGNSSSPGRNASTPLQPAMGPTRPVIQADSRMNAVIIKDRPSQMKIYKELISLLDVPSQLIEIEAMIVDVNTSHMSQLGVDWSLRQGNVAANNEGIGIALDLTKATVVTDAANFLLTRIKALEGSGNAKIISRPSILTVDNLGALIDLSETFYIQTIGERVANVVPVSVGVTLKVTPHMIEEDGRKSVQLIVDIEDGSIQDVKIQSLPTVRRSTIGTQAVMGERESLLIGGFNSQQSMNQTEGVPILGQLPIIGALFSKTVNNVERKERLFLITPRIIPQGAAQIRASR